MGMKKAKGKRPVYFDEPQLDKLLSAIVALTGEVSVLRERLDTVERLLATKEVISLAEIEAYQPEELVAQAREQWRSEYIARVLGVLQEETVSE
ncbi:hypothetical protein B7486_44210 [cyanobacterium TDX16]|nr:hypothetical protein B7486_44210 [cyanobacterium TDX16]